MAVEACDFYIPWRFTCNGILAALQLKTIKIRNIKNTVFISGVTQIIVLCGMSLTQNRNLKDDDAFGSVGGAWSRSFAKMNGTPTVCIFYLSQIRQRPRIKNKWYKNDWLMTQKVPCFRGWQILMTKNIFRNKDYLIEPKQRTETSVCFSFKQPQRKPGMIYDANPYFKPLRKTCINFSSDKT